ncbi:MAG TPA: DNA repair protein RecN [Rhodospirillaceae bacterium]|nr:DNA repair protein RecN [Rhodospirillaceae bacterium]HAT35904.1 DNA repair protein RecN [Rhodospirillaceae bacterium]
MLTALSIRNVVLIERLDITFGRGLSVLTGETGAGKSILLDALGLALGARSDARLLRHGSEQATVVAQFSTIPEGQTALLLEEQGIESEGEILMRRVLGQDGRTRAFVNDQPVSIGFLRQLGDALAEIQGQFDERGLMDQATHLDVLDNCGRLSEMRQATVDAFAELQEARRDLAIATEAAQKAKDDEDFLRHSVAELQRLDPQPGEETELAETRQLLMNAEKVADALNAAFEDLEGDGGVENRLRKALAHVERGAEKAGSALDPAAQAVERAVIETEEAIGVLRDSAANMDLDGNRLEEVEDRLYALRDVARKHRVEVEALAALREEFEGKLALIENQSDRIDELAAKEKKLRSAYIERATALRNARRKASDALDKAVNAELPPLKLEKASFTTQFEELAEEHWGESGMDKVAFLVTTNPGAPAGPLSKIASGGELSRFMLALKVVLAASGGPTTLVFDEVDSGVGGATADAVGERLARLSNEMQVLVVTHSPQVAARGNIHLRVEKLSENEDTVTEVDRLLDGDRREEVARMLSGAEITDEARAAADQLIHGDTR